MTKGSKEGMAEDHDIGRKMLTGSIWSFGVNSLQQILGLARIIILARLLLPSDFGLLGIAVLTLYGLDVFSQTGFQQALVNKKTDISSDLNAVWTLLVGRGILLFVILMLLAPFIADFFATTEAIPVLQVMGISMILQGLTNPGIILFLKDLDFKRQYLFRFSGVLADFIVCIGAALILQNVWALVFGLVAKDLTLMAMSYIIHPYRPRFDLDLKKVRSLSNYGIWILITSALVFLLIEGDDILVGRLLGVAALGLYQMAYAISNTPSTEISQIIAQVAFPVYSKLQDDLDSLKELFLGILRLTALLSFLLIGFLVALAPDITMVFLGEVWSPIIPLIQILAWWGLMRGLGEVSAALFMAIGRPRVNSKLQFVQVVLLFALFYPLITQYGLIGISIAVVASAIPSFFLSINAINSILGVQAKEPFALLFYPLAMSVSGTAMVFLVRHALFPTPDPFSFLALLGVYAVIVLMGIYLLERFSDYRVWTILRSYSRIRTGDSWNAR